MQMRFSESKYQAVGAEIAKQMDDHDSTLGVVCIGFPPGSVTHIPTQSLDK